MTKHKIHWADLNRTIEAQEGQSVLDAALDNDIPLNHACGGYCACTTCHIQVKEGASNISKMEEDEDDRLASVSERTGISRLACQSKVLGDIVVEISRK